MGAPKSGETVWHEDNYANEKATHAVQPELWEVLGKETAAGVNQECSVNRTNQRLLSADSGEDH